MLEFIYNNRETILVRGLYFFMSEKSLNDELDKKLRDYISINYPVVEDFDYHFDEEGNRITLTGKINMPNSEVILHAIDDVEEILNVHYVGVRSVNGSHAFTYEFNE